MFTFAQYPTEFAQHRTIADIEIHPSKLEQRRPERKRSRDRGAGSSRLTRNVALRRTARIVARLPGQSCELCMAQRLGRMQPALAQFHDPARTSRHIAGAMRRYDPRAARGPRGVEETVDSAAILRIQAIVEFVEQQPVRL